MEDATMLEHDGWIPLAEYCALYSEKPATVHRRVADGIWERGVVFAAPTSTQSYVHLPSAQAWQEKRAAREAARAASHPANQRMVS